MAGGVPDVDDKADIIGLKQAIDWPKDQGATDGDEGGDAGLVEQGRFYEMDARVEEYKMTQILQ
jgi:hypothetical protein